MTIAHQFAYHKAVSLDEAVEVLTQAGPDARILAGGTDLIAWLRDDAIHPDTRIDIKGVPGLDEISLDGDHIYLGPLVTFTDLLTSDLIEQWISIKRKHEIDFIRLRPHPGEFSLYFNV